MIPEIETRTVSSETIVATGAINSQRWALILRLHKGDQDIIVESMTNLHFRRACEGLGIENVSMGALAVMRTPTTLILFESIDGLLISWIVLNWLWQTLLLCTLDGRLLLQVPNRSFGDKIPRRTG